ncbi:nuclear transport factor 2 family protein [bacterium]
MKKIGLILMMITVIISCQHGRPTLSESERDDIESAILALNDIAVKAAQHADLETMFDTIGENDRGVIIRDGNLIKTKAEAFELYQQLFQNVAKVEYIFNQQYVHVLSKEIAYLTASGESVMTTRDQREFRTPFAQTIVYVKQGDAWKVLHTHASTPNRK